MKLSIDFFYQRFLSILREEEANYLCWFLCSYITGLAIYFSSTNEPSWQMILIALSLMLVAIILSRKYRTLLLLLFFLLLGILLPACKASLIAQDMSRFRGERFYKIQGKIESILPAETGYSVIIIGTAKSKFKNKKLKAKLRVRTKLNGASSGDIIEVSAILYPPSPSVVKGGYNFARKAFFEKVSAVGYSVSQFKILEKGESNFLSNYRFKTVDNITNFLGEDVGGMASALIVGEYGSMGRKVLEDFRIAGISHILSVSGMHLSLVAGIFFICARKLLLLVRINQLRYHAKKIAAITAIICSFLYLAVSGFKVAAIRAFIMSAFFFAAICFSRQIFNIRTITMTAMIILFIWPENIVSPSFQMSFLAVLAIIICFKFLSENKFFSGIYPVVKYFILLAITSLVASIATSLIVPKMVLNLRLPGERDFSP